MSRFGEPQHPDFQRLNASIGFDRRLWPYDIEQSRAHADMLAASGIIEASDRDEVVRALAAQGVQSKPYLPAIHLMSFYRERFGHRPGEFPVCEDVAARSLALPFFPAMSEGQVARVAEAMRLALVR